MDKNEQLKPLIISPPFGRFIDNMNCTSVMGTYTINPRKGWLSQAIKTVRPIKGGGWVHKITLANAGATNIKKFHPNRIYSVAGLSNNEWLALADHFPTNSMIELNISCPTVSNYTIKDGAIRRFVDRYSLVTAKLSPSIMVDKFADRCVANGVGYLHLSNAIPVSRGGESGKRLKQINLPIVERIAKKHPNIVIIAGGGIYSRRDLADYRDAGAQIFSVATVCFRPWRLANLIEAAYE